MEKLMKRYTLFQTTIFIIAMYAFIDSIVRFKYINKMSFALFILSVLTGVIMSMMVIIIGPGKGSMDLTDAMVAFIFIEFGLSYAVIFTVIYSSISEYLRSNMITKDKNLLKCFNNLNMFVVSSYFSGLILNNSAYRLDRGIASFLYVSLFLLINITIFSITMTLLKGRQYKFKSEGILLLIINFTVSVILTNLQCIIYKAGGFLGTTLMFAILIIIHYCFYIYRKLEVRNECIKGLLKITRDIVKYGDFAQKCKYAVMNLKRIIPYSVCGIYTFDSNDCIVYPVAHIAPDELDIGELGFELSEKSQTYSTIKEGKIYCSINVKNDKKIRIEGKLLEYVKTAIFVPIKIEDKIVGIIFIGGKEDLLSFMQNGINDILDILSNQIALAIENDRVFRNIKNKADKDSLTKLYNRRVFDIEIRNLIKEGTDFSLVIYDIDDFKQVNDNFGHVVGDQVLKNVSEIIMKSIRKTDIPCRYGGEEISIIFKNLSKDDAYIISERIRQSIENMCTQWYGNNVYVTVSGGVSSYPEDGGTVEELVESADRVLYSECKRKGKNKVSAYNLKVISIV